MYNIPTDLYGVIISFHDGVRNVYATFNHKYLWQRINIFENKNILKIKCGTKCAFCLESNGNVWCFGKSEHGQLGLGTKEKWIEFEPAIIPYFQNNKIIIIDICCGFGHNLAISYDHRVFVWGKNNFGQCGVGHIDDIFIPYELKFNVGQKIKGIDCGGCHSYIQTWDDKHFLFGANHYRQCLRQNIESPIVKYPYLINVVISSYSSGKIKRVILGNKNTTIILH